MSKVTAIEAAEAPLTAGGAILEPSHAGSPFDAPGTDQSLIWQRFSVPYEYPVAFTRGLFDAGNDLLRATLGTLAPRARLLVFLDAGLATSWPDLCEKIEAYFAPEGSLVSAPEACDGGELVKRDDRLVQHVLRRIHAFGIDRQSVVMGIGGGAFLDAVGYAAAIAHRGVRHVRVPTTVLGQNDSGVGVKNGINAFGAKNFLGTFSPPLAVFNDSRFLTTLNDRDRAAGMAESVKVAVLRDPVFFSWLEANADALRRFDLAAVEPCIRRTAELHLRQIAGSGDPFERGNARPLDFGHWSAHKLESMSGYRLRHGEAVAIGMALDCHYATLSGMLPLAETQRICAVLGALGLPTYDALLELDSPNGTREFLRGLEDFRQHLGGSLSVPLLRTIGEEIQVGELDRTRVVQAAAMLRQLQAA